MRTLWILACVLGLSTVLHAEDEREMDVEKLHEATGTTSRQIFCTYAASRRGANFAQNASASVSGNRPLEALLDDACQQCAANRLPCKLEKLVLVEYDSATRKQVDSEIVLDADVDVSCPLKADAKGRVANGAKAKLKALPLPKKAAVRPPVPPAQFPHPWPNPWMVPGGFVPPLVPPPGLFPQPFQNQALQDYEARQQEAFRWFQQGRTMPRPK